MLKKAFALVVLTFCTSLFPIMRVTADSCYPPCYGSSSCDPLGRSWLDVEYLYWKIKDSPEPVPLVLESTIGVPVLGSPGSTIVLGGEKIDTKWRSGSRYSVGYWFDESQCLGIEANYLILPEISKKKSVGTNGELGSPFLYVPYFNVVTGLEDSSGLALPGVFQGQAQLKLKNRMQNSELNLLVHIPYDDCAATMTAIAGFRYWNLDEKMSFKTDSPFIPPFPVDVYRTKDKFYAENNFYGGQIGLQLDYLYHCFLFSLKGKVALGSLYQEAKIDGSLITNDFSATGDLQTFPGGYFAMPSNLGKHKQSRFAVIPEVNFNMGFRLLDELSVQIGYSFLYVNNVLWSGHEINPNINPTQSTVLSGNPNPVLIGEARPKARSKTSDFWAQGLNVGIHGTF